MPTSQQPSIISAEFPYMKQRRRIFGHDMAYVDVGEGDPIVLLHGNPTSSYLWRNVLPNLETLGRCIAPDLIGMGDSDKLPNSGPGSYRFVEHRRYLDALLEGLAPYGQHVLQSDKIVFGTSVHLRVMPRTARTEFLTAPPQDSGQREITLRRLAQPRQGLTEDETDSA